MCYVRAGAQQGLFIIGLRESMRDSVDNYLHRQLPIILFSETFGLPGENAQDYDRKSYKRSRRGHYIRLRAVQFRPCMPLVHLLPALAWAVGPRNLTVVTAPPACWPAEHEELQPARSWPHLAARPQLSSRTRRRQQQNTSTVPTHEQAAQDWAGSASLGPQ